MIEPHHELWRRDAYRVSVGKPQVKIPLGRPRHRWKENKKKIVP
jgi:hypothetical protein